MRAYPRAGRAQGKLWTFWGSGQGFPSTLRDLVHVFVEYFQGAESIYDVLEAQFQAVMRLCGLWSGKQVHARERDEWLRQQGKTISINLCPGQWDDVVDCILNEVEEGRNGGRNNFKGAAAHFLPRFGV